MILRDKEISNLIQAEEDRQNEGIELIASENYTSKQIREACGSILTNKYAEGYPNKRYYGGCEIIDKVEQLAIDRACQLFNVKYANVQPHSGSQANMAAYYSMLNLGDKILSPDLNAGGHLTHSSPVSFVSKLYKVFTYGVDKNGRLNYDEIEKQALKERPKLIVTGFSAYPYDIDFKRFREIADKVGAYLMVDMAHIAGIVAAKYCSNPCDYADVVTSTSHKTLRGPRGAFILTNSEDLIKKINSSVFPRLQGGPLEHIIAGKAICFKEANSESFKKYIRQVLVNTTACCRKLESMGAIVSSTENHLFLLNTLESYGLTGKEAQAKLESVGITTNKNMLPNDTLKPNETSGLRIGFAALTTRGATKSHAESLAYIIHKFLSNELTEATIKYMVKSITDELKSMSEI